MIKSKTSPNPPQDPISEEFFRNQLSYLILYKNINIKIYILLFIYINIKIE